jgi:hypothetical protein
VRPLAQSDGHDAPWLIDELVPGRTAMVDEIVVGFEDAIGEPIVAQELPDVFDRVEDQAGWHLSTRLVVPANVTHRGRLSSSSPNHAAGTHQNLGAMVSEPT